MLEFIESVNKHISFRLKYFFRLRSQCHRTVHNSFVSFGVASIRFYFLCRHCNRSCRRIYAYGEMPLSISFSADVHSQTDYIRTDFDQMLPKCIYYVRFAVCDLCFRFDTPSRESQVVFAVCGLYFDFAFHHL